MEKPWKIHGKKSMNSLENPGAWSQSKIPWFSWGISILSMLAWDRKIVRIFLMESMGFTTVENHGKNGKLQK